MSDDLTAAPERIWLKAYDGSYTHPSTTWAETSCGDDCDGDVEYVRADLCAPVDAEGAARELLKLMAEYFEMSGNPIRLPLATKVADVIRSHCNSAEGSLATALHVKHLELEKAEAEVTRLQAEVERLEEQLFDWKLVAERLTKKRNPTSIELAQAWDFLEGEKVAAQSQLTTTRAEAIRECEKFMEHEKHCASNERYPSPPCDCGLAALLEGESNAKV